MENRKQTGRGGARPGAGRPRKSRKPIELTGPVDPVVVLESIAGDGAAPASARVAAAKALLMRRPPAAPTDSPQEHQLRDLNAKALQLMGVKGTA